MLKETDTEETIGFFVTFYRWWHFNRGARPLPGYAYFRAYLLLNVRAHDFFLVGVYLLFRFERQH